MSSMVLTLEANRLYSSTICNLAHLSNRWARLYYWLIISDLSSSRQIDAYFYGRLTK